VGATHSSFPQIPVPGTRKSFAVKQTLSLAFLGLAAASTALAGQAIPGSANSTQTPSHVLDGTATLVSHYSPNQMLRLVLGLQPRNLAEEKQLIEQLHDKKSPQFHQFLTADQWRERFAPSAEDEQAVVDWAQSQGFTVTYRFKSRMGVDVEAPVSTIEKALGVTINSYQYGPRSFFSNDHDPSLPSNLAGVVQAVFGLNNYGKLRPANRKFHAPDYPVYTAGPAIAQGRVAHADGDPSKRAPQKKDSAGPDETNGAYDPSDIYNSQAYDFGFNASGWGFPLGGLYNQGHCCNPLNNPSGSPADSSIAIASGGDVALSDMDGFHNQYPYLAFYYYTYQIDGVPSCDDWNPSSPPCDAETTQDTEWTTATANSFGSYLDTARVYVYEGAGDPGSFYDVYLHMMDDGYARTMSSSYACAEDDCWTYSTAVQDDSVFTSMVAQGWTLTVSAGDQGATGSCEAHDVVIYPAADPNIVAAGGTTLWLSPGPVFSSETAWSGGPDYCYTNDGGGGGGFSIYWPTPSYQSALGFGSRAVPDVALNSDWYNAPQNVFWDGVLYSNCKTQEFCGGGTSIAAPEMAGFFAQEEAYLLSMGNVCGYTGAGPCAPMGNADYYIYDAGLYGGPHDPFYDITSGCNNNDITAYYGLGYYCAGPGFDEVTGWGSPNMLQLAWAINYWSTIYLGAPTVTFSGPAINKWYNSEQTVSWTVSDNSYTGVAGFTQGWDSIPADVYSEAHPGTGNSFYSGPQFPNATTGWLDFVDYAVSQGCHTAYVEAWDNMGEATGNMTYGPVCYDTIAPVTTATLSGTYSGGVYTSAVTVTLTATDSGSGVQTVFYKIDAGGWLTYTAPFSVSALGAHTVSFYATDKAGNVEGTVSVSFTIDSSTATSVSSSLNPSTYGQSVTFTATVTSSGGTPPGTVTFKNGASTLGTGTLSGGKAAFAISTLAAGSNSITAVYGGSGSFLGSTSAVLTQTVKQAATSTSVVSGWNPSNFGGSVKFTATVTSSTGTPTGTVTFKDGSTTLGTGALSSGKATFSTLTLAVGTHSITAVYTSTTDFGGSTSPVLTQTVNQAITKTTVVSSLNPSTSGATVKFTATVTSGGGTATGTVTFKDGSTTLGTATLSNSKATFSTSSLAVGTHSITAVYGGSTDFSGSTSPALSQVVNP
jgi:hypothetical protein